MELCPVRPIVSVVVVALTLILMLIFFPLNVSQNKETINSLINYK